LVASIELLSLSKIKEQTLARWSCLANGVNNDTGQLVVGFALVLEEVTDSTAVVRDFSG
jgi:hypothetical protein